RQQNRQCPPEMGVLRGRGPAPSGERPGQALARPEGEEARQGPRPGRPRRPAGPRRLPPAPQPAGLRRRPALRLLTEPPQLAPAPAQAGRPGRAAASSQPDRAEELLAELGPATSGERTAPLPPSWDDRAHPAALRHRPGPPRLDSPSARPPALRLIQDGRCRSLAPRLPARRPSA